MRVEMRGTCRTTAARDVIGLRLHRRRSRVPWIFLVYHAVGNGQAVEGAAVKVRRRRRQPRQLRLF
jgi:hypothetical protein